MKLNFINQNITLTFVRFNGISTVIIVFYSKIFFYFFRYFCCMKLLTFISVFISIQIFAQTVTINWENPRVLFPEQKNAEKYPYFSNGNYALQEGAPVFSYLEDASFSGKVNLTHLQWQAVSSSQLGGIRPTDIPSEDDYFASVNSARGQKKLSVVIKTFKRQGNTYYRLNGFTIERAAGTNIQTYSNTFRPTDFTSESVLEHGTWYKIKINQTGVYKIDKNFLQKLGINVNGLNPKNIRIYGNGGGMLPEPTSDFRYGNLQENAIQVIGEEDGVFNDSDYVLFYAQGADFWDRRSASFIRHKKNIYEDFAYYFLTVDNGEGKRITSTAYANPNGKRYTEYDDFQFFEEDKNNLNQQGRLWVGDNLGMKNTQEISFPVHDLVDGSTITWRFYWVTNYAQNNVINISYNSANINTTNLTSPNFFVSGSTLGTVNASGGKLNFSVNFNNSSNPVGELYPDYFEVLYKQKLIFNGTQMNFRTFDAVENGQIHSFDFSGTAPEQVWNVSDPVNAKKLEKRSNANSYSYQSSSSNFKNELVAFNAASAYTPETIGRIGNQSLHSLSNVDYVIVTVPGFLSEANRLKQYHQTVNHLNVAVVTTNQIYNEFSSGGQDLVGIRDFFRYLYQKDGRLKYALLLGSGTYDFKNKLKQNYNLVPSYQSYNSTGYSSSFVTDDFFAMLDDDEAQTGGFSDPDLASSQLDIAVGRMIAKNISEARLCVDKSLKYDNSASPQGTPFGDWRLKAALIVDYDTGSFTPIFHDQMDATVGAFFQNSLPQFTLRKLYIDAFKADYTSGGARYPQVNEAIRNAVSNGTLIINYLGHGGPTSLSQGRVFSADDLKTMNNINSNYTRLPLFITVSCDISIWDNPILNSLGDQLYLKDSGGAGAMITTTREIGVFTGLGMNPVIIQNLFVLSGNKYQPMGEALRQSKLQYASYDNRKISLLGDPAQSLSRPQTNIALTKINGVDAASFNGTLRALDFVSLEGNVLNASNAVDNTFNGTVQATLYDKPMQKTTLNNPGYLTPTLNYTEQITAIYKGSAAVKNGSFKIEFYIPKDINYQVGEGKLVLYADNSKTDASSFNNKINVGDINPNGIQDNEGPAIHLYMNNLSFANGGITDRNPYFLACVTDSTGINSTGAGVGHDITGVLDENVNGTLVFNDSYTGGEVSPCLNPKLKDYQKGKVWHQLSNMDLGEHTIQFKVWDINNNSSIATLDFIVVEDGDQRLIIKKLLNWPNPFTTKTFFHFEHNCPDILNVQVQIFTVAGKLIKTINTTVSSEPFYEGYRTDKYGIEWNGLDDFGDKIGKGVYIYRVKVSGTSDKCRGSATQVEKLVILK